jgi:transposase
MAGNGRRRFNAAIKARVAIEALREQKTVAQIAREVECHPSPVAKGTQAAVEGLAAFFARPRGERSEERLIPRLYEQVGRLKREVAWFKTTFGASASQAGELGRTRGRVARDTPMRAVGAASHQPRRRACWGDAPAPLADAARRRAVHPDAVRWVEADDGLAQTPGVGGEPHARAAADAPDGAGGAVSEAAPQSGWSGARHGSVLAGRT